MDSTYARRSILILDYDQVLMPPRTFLSNFLQHMDFGGQRQAVSYICGGLKSKKNAEMITKFNRKNQYDVVVVAIG